MSEKAVSRILDIPAHLRIAFACRIGYPDSMLDGCYPRVRREVQEFTHYNPLRQSWAGLAKE